MKDLVPEEIVYRQRIVRLDHNNHHPVGFVYRLADRTHRTHFDPVSLGT